MDKLANRLREDAAKIEAEVSPELDARIRASLERETRQPAQDRRHRRRPLSTWWASGLTGIAAASALLVLINLERPAPPAAVPDAPVHNPFAMPELKTETAILIGPLEEELENLESDLRKAERAVKEEIGLTL